MMLNWSVTRYKFTLGLGCLGSTALLSDLTNRTVPVSAIMVIVMVPLVGFLFADPDLMPVRWVLRIQNVCALWYLTAAGAILACLTLYQPQPRPHGTLFFVALLTVGLIPCVLALRPEHDHEYEQWLHPQDKPTDPDWWEST